MKKEIAINFIKNHSLTGIKAGSERQTFLDIWMVVVEDRIFARSWGFAEKSWYNSFLQNPSGQIKCGENVFDIKASIPADHQTITEKINSAYLTKYNSGENIIYANGIVKEKHVERTMEFTVVE